MKQGVNILVVDDEPMVRDAIERMLKHAGHVVVGVDNGEDALSLLKQRKFEIVMTDFSMPGMQGDQLVARIRQMLPDQPIIMATAFADEYKVFGRPPGNVDALLLKPFSYRDLVETIEQVLASTGLAAQPEDVPPSLEERRHKEE